MIDSACSYEFVNDTHKDFFRVEFMRIGYKGWFKRKWQVHVHVNNRVVHTNSVHTTWLSAFPTRDTALFFITELGFANGAIS